MVECRSISLTDTLDQRLINTQSTRPLMQLTLRRFRRRPIKMMIRNDTSVSQHSAVYWPALNEVLMGSQLRCWSSVGMGWTEYQSRYPWGVDWDIREFTKPQRQRQRERHRTKDLKARTMAVHLRFNSWYISLTSSAKQQREMTKSCVVWRTWATTANFLNFYFKLIVAFRI